ncbi:hypothetical protein [Hansschlegelia sp.]|uniref:hypothetical protein n=1 Tax=Hansschlegelia sp. TaxID=2041892 RepID=UPI002B986492|nr:hypothetical protein [Hansschlegelia sp.]HVI27510.1 hypothetical protein [Hansschlegelia sp.]
MADATPDQIEAAWNDYCAEAEKTKGRCTLGDAGAASLAWMRFMRLFCTPEQRAFLASKGAPSMFRLDRGEGND